MSITPADDRAHDRADDGAHGSGWVDEWVFAAWAPGGTAGLLSGHRIVGRTAWYWWALVRAGRPLLQVTEWDVAVRADPMIVKAPEMWAGHDCVEPLRQWTIGNEAHAVALDDPADAIERAYGTPTAVSTDLEWYATGAPSQIDMGFQQEGVVHGVIEFVDHTIEWAEVAARRWRRWVAAGTPLGPLVLPDVRVHTGLRAPFRFPDGTVTDWVLTGSGWCSRSPGGRRALPTLRPAAADRPRLGGGPDA